MKIVVAGSSGLIGTALVASLRSGGHQVERLVRRATIARDEYRWVPERGIMDTTALAGADAVVNLCGADIGAGRWTGAFKQELRDSRITPTDVLAETVRTAGVPTLVNASAIHYYGDTAAAAVTETSPNGTGFLPTLCRDWEAATEPAQRAGVRTVLLRTGVVLARHSNLMSQLRPLFWLGLGGRFGNGRQYLSWISLADAIAAIRFLLEQDTMSGPVNLVGPAPVTNAEFTKALGRAMNRPTRLTVPAFVLKAVVGTDMAREGILSGPRAIPAALESAGFTFCHNTIGAALADAVG